MWVKCQGCILHKFILKKGFAFLWSPSCIIVYLLYNKKKETIKYSIVIGAARFDAFCG